MPTRTRKLSGAALIWHSIPPGVRAAVISFGLLAILFVVNGLAVTLFITTGFTFSPAMICYPVQLVAYILNGMIAGWQADLTRAYHKIHLAQHGAPNYIAHGGLAGVVLALLAALIYLASNAVIATFVPIAVLVGLSAPWLLIVADVVASTGLGMLGGILFSHWFASPARK